MRSRAFTLIELTLAVGTVALFACGGAMLALATHPAAVPDAVSRLAALIDAGRALAGADGDGATIVFEPAPSGRSGFVATLYRHRPLPGVTLEPGDAEPYASSASVALAGVAATPPFALFIDQGGTVSAAAWQLANGALDVEPTCARPLALTLSDGGRVTHVSVPCDAAVMR